MEQTKPKEPKEQKKYRLVVYEKKSYKELMVYEFSKNKAYFVGVSILLLIALIMSLLFIYTPLNYFFPSRSNAHLKEQIVNNAILIDSLENRLTQHNKYIVNLKDILQGKIPTDTLKREATIKQETKKNDNIEVTDTYMDSVIKKQIETSELESVTRSGTNIKAEDNIKNLHFFVPLKGTISNEFNSNAGHFGVDIIPENDKAVLSTLAGTVIMNEWSLKSGHVIAVQHSNNLISFYKHNASTLKETGDRVTAGESIAIAGNSGENTSGPHLHFELWKNGIPVNPKDYINF